MERIKVLILDSDADYANALGNALAAHDSIFQIEILSCGQNEVSEMILKRMKETNLIILIGEQNSEVLQMEETNGALVLCLVPFGKEHPVTKGYVNKYAGLSNIASQLQLMAASRSGTERRKYVEGTAKLLGVTSGSGGSGKTTLSIAIARELAFRSDIPVLYLSFDEAEATRLYFPGCEGKITGNDLIYYVHTENENYLASYLNAFLVKDAFNVETLRPPKGINEFAAASISMVEKVLQQINKCKNYEYIVLDYSLEAKERTHWLLDNCFKTVIVDVANSASDLKYRTITEYLEAFYGPFMREKCVFVQNKWVPHIQEYSSGAICAIEYEPESFRIKNGRLEIDNSLGFGMGVKRIAGEICREH